MHGTDRRSLARHYLEQGMGKAEVARRLGVARRTVYNWIESGALQGRFKRRLKTLIHPALLVIDEIGYLKVSERGARLFFLLVNGRYGRASTVLTSNVGFEQWGQILHDEVMAAALLDRLLHHCHLVNIRGNSYRMRRHMDLSKTIHPTASHAADAENARREAST